MPNPPPLPKIPPPLPSQKLGQFPAYEGELPPVIEEYESRQISRKSNKKNIPTPRDPISGIQWGLLFVFTGTVDLLEFGLVLLFEIGAFINPFIDIAMGMILPFIYFMMGITMGPKQVASVIGSFGLEISDTGTELFPTWSGDVLVVMMWHKAAQKAKQTAIGNVAVSALEIRGGIKARKPAPSQGGIPPVITPNGTLPPKIGSSGRPLANPGEVPPIIQTPPPLPNPQPGTLRSSTSSLPPPLPSTIPNRASSENQVPPSNVVDLRDQFNPRYNPKHERVEGRDDGYREAA